VDLLTQTFLSSNLFYLSTTTPPHLHHISSTSLPHLFHISSTSLPHLFHISSTSLPLNCLIKLSHLVMISQLGNFLSAHYPKVSLTYIHYCIIPVSSSSDPIPIILSVLLYTFTTISYHLPRPTTPSPQSCLHNSLSWPKRKPQPPLQKTCVLLHLPLTQPPCEASASSSPTRMPHSP
jgi:hypothetical protein